MAVTEIPSQQFQNSFKRFSKYLVDLHKLPTFDSVAKAEAEIHERIEGGFEEMNSGEMQIVLLMQQVVEVYARDRQMQITGRNPFEVIMEMNEAGTKNEFSA